MKILLKPLTLLTITLLTSIIFNACFMSSEDDKVGEASPQDSSDSTAYIEIIDTVDSSEHFSVLLERLECTTYCPEYSIRVDHKGEVIYNGKTNVLIKDFRINQMSTVLLDTLITKLAALEQFEYEEVYNKSSESCESVEFFSTNSRITFIRAGKIQVIDHFHGCLGFPGQVELTEFENWVDTSFDTMQYIEE